MAKKYVWKIADTAEDGTEATHSVELECSYFTGKAIVVIDGDSYNISVKPFSLRGTNQIFRLGELPAMLDFPRKGEPTVTVDGEKIPHV